MNIAVASLGDPKSVTTWSGIPAHIIFELENIGHKITPVTLHHPKEPWYYSWIRRIYYRLQKRWFLSSLEEHVLRLIGKDFDEQVMNIKPDVVIAIHGDILAQTTFKQPACIIHDTTFATLLNYYPDFTGLTKRSIVAGSRMYQKALDRSNAAVFSSAWASNSAIKDYGAHAEKIHTLPFGGNLSTIPHIDDVNTWINQRSNDKYCKFLFLGVNWIRKGGPDALLFVKALNKSGIQSQLIVVGCIAEVAPDDKKFIEQVGFLRKNVPDEHKRLKELFIHCHALLVPSLAECYGCVYCEANAYGLPALGRNTGGVPEIIWEGVNGLLLNKGESAETFSNRWIDVWSNSTRYGNLSINSRREYDERLNYRVFAKDLQKILKSLIDK